MKLAGISFAGGSPSGMASVTTPAASFIVDAEAMRIAEAKRRICREAMVYKVKGERGNRVVSSRGRWSEYKAGEQAVGAVVALRHAARGTSALPRRATKRRDADAFLLTRCAAHVRDVPAIWAPVCASRSRRARATWSAPLRRNFSQLPKFVPSLTLMHDDVAQLRQLGLVAVAQRVWQYHRFY